MGYYMLLAACYICGMMFSSNPHYVPSINREHVFCKPCVERANVLRVEKGLEPIYIHPEAYEPAPEYPEDEY